MGVMNPWTRVRIMRKPILSQSIKGKGRRVSHEYRGNTKKRHRGVQFYYSFILLAPTGFGTQPLPSLSSVIQRVLDFLYWGVPYPIRPITLSREERNDD